MKQEQPTIEGLKFCKKCGKYKPISEFYRNASIKDKHENQCKECRIKYSREHYAKTKSKRKSQNNTYYASNKDKMREYSMTQYYSTDYLEKKYLKRYQASLEKALAKKAHLEDSDTWKENPSFHMKQRMKKYESAIERWKTKIHEAEELIALYAENKAKAQEAENLEPTPMFESIKETDLPTRESNEPKEETPKEENIMTKEQLIALLADVPDNAQIIYVGDTDSRSSLVAAWRTDEHSVCIRNLSTDMPYIITEGKLYDLVSASMSFTNEGLRIDDTKK